VEIVEAFMESIEDDMEAEEVEDTMGEEVDCPTISIIV
jgi:hypothetical protein